MVKFDTSSQVEQKEDSLPLVSNYFKKRKDLREHYFAVNEFKESKSGDWLICNAVGQFTILVNTESSQYKSLMNLIEHCKSQGTAVICVYSKETKSGVIFGEDEESQVNWENPQNWDYRFNLGKSSYLSKIPPLPSTQNEGETAKPSRKPRNSSSPS